APAGPGQGRGAAPDAEGDLQGRAGVMVARSCYSFLRGPSTPEALVARASALGLRWLALADDDSLAGAVPFWTCCRSAGIKPVLGARVGGRVYLIQNRCGYANLCRLITKRKLATEDTESTEKKNQKGPPSVPPGGAGGISSKFSSVPSVSSVANLEGLVEVGN